MTLITAVAKVGLMVADGYTTGTYSTIDKERNKILEFNKGFLGISGLSVGIGITADVIKDKDPKTLTDLRWELYNCEKSVLIKGEKNGQIEMQMMYLTHDKKLFLSDEYGHIHEDKGGIASLGNPNLMYGEIPRLSQCSEDEILPSLQVSYDWIAEKYFTIGPVHTIKYLHSLQS